MNNIRTLWYFLSAMSCGGVMAGARKLGIAQATMSGALKELEIELGTPLFDQTPIGLRPTAAAIRLRDYAMWLVAEVEQAFLDAQAGGLSQAEPVSVSTFGVPRCSAADWAVMGALFESVAAGGPRGGVVSIDQPMPAQGSRDAIAIRYGFADEADDRATVVADTWSLVVPRNILPAGRTIAWSELSRLRLLMPAPDDALARRIAQGPQPLQVEAVAPDAAGAPYGLLDRKDAALLLPATGLPEQFVGSGLQMLKVRDAPVLPAIRIEHPHQLSEAGSRLIRIIAGQLRKALAGEPTVPLLRSLEAKIDLHTLRCFHATVETGNTTQAAAACFIVQPALSRQIRKLEEAVGRQLFTRSPSGMVPTAAGQRLHGFIEPVLNDHSTASERLPERQRNNARATRIRLGIIPAANEDSLIAQAAARAISGWRTDFAASPLSVAEGYTSVLLRWLRTHLIDLAVVETTENHPGLDIVPILREPISLIFAAGSVWDTPEETVDGRTIEGSGLVIPSKRFGLRALFDRAFAGAGVNIAPGLEVDNLAIALQLVRSGQWATLLPPSAVHLQLRGGKLKQRLLAFPAIERQICIALRARARLQPEAVEFLPRLVAAFSAAIASGGIAGSFEAAGEGQVRDPAMGKTGT